VHESTGDVYYYNDSTRETTWEAPQGFEDESTQEVEEDEEEEPKEEEEDSKKADAEASAAESLATQKEPVVRDVDKAPETTLESPTAQTEPVYTDVAEKAGAVESPVVLEDVEEAPDTTLESPTAQMEPVYTDVVEKVAKTPTERSKKTSKRTPSPSKESDSGSDAERASTDIDEEALLEDRKRSESKLADFKAQAARRRELMRQRRLVFQGKLDATSGGLTKEDLLVNKRGRVVSKKKHEMGLVAQRKYLQAWIDAVVSARESLGIKGMQPVGGESEAGQRLLAKARAIYESAKSDESDKKS
jgi:hypothetical protein